MRVRHRRKVVENWGSMARQSGPAAPPSGPERELQAGTSADDVGWMLWTPDRDRQTDTLTSDRLATDRGTLP